MKLSIHEVSRGCTALALAALFGALRLVSPAPAGAAESRTLPGHVPAAVAQLKPLARLEATQRLKLAIGLPLRDKEGLTNLLQEIYDPASPSYHRYLSAAEFAERFGPSPAEYEAVSAFAAANGLTVTATHPNRTVLDVEGTVDQIEKALNVTMRVYQHPTEARTFYAPDTDPSPNVGVPLLHIAGLDNYIRPFPKIKKSLGPVVSVAPKAGSGPNGNYMGYDFRAAYAPGVALTGAGQSVALFELDGYFPGDIAAYLTQAGLPSVPLRNVLLDGFNGAPGFANTEVALDIDMAICMAPGLSEVVVYEGFIPLSVINRIATDNSARQISCSWGWLPFDPTTDQVFQQYAAQGQSFFNASGDDCAEVAPIFPPADDPYITQVGGTTLTTTGPGGSWVGEVVWNWGTRYGPAAAGIGSTGGISDKYPIPVWQQGIDMTLNQGSTTMRNLPDVALTADDIYIIADNGFPEPGTGGTSAAAPLWAGFAALINQQAAANGEPPIGFVNPALYALAEGASYTAYFHDITSGNNTNTISPSKFFAVPGYDLCTGWGTPTGTNLINALAPPVQNVPHLVVVTNYISGGNGDSIIDYDECDNLYLVLANVGNRDATGIRMVISTVTPGVTIAQASSAYVDIPAGGFATNLVAFKLSTAPEFVCGALISLDLSIKSDQATTASQTVLPSGTPGTTLRFDNSVLTPIPDGSGEVDSPVLVSGISFAASRLAVSVHIIHPNDSDLVLQLISPDGVTNTLARNLGDGGQGYGLGCSPDSLRTTFDDSAVFSIVGGTPPFAGAFQPQQPLGIFAGKGGASVNGQWLLRVADQVPGNAGAIQCWSLFITPASCGEGGGECPGSDLAVNMTALPNPVMVGDQLTYAITVTNKGPSAANNVSMSQTLPLGAVLVSASASQGACSISGGILTANLGRMSSRSGATVTVVVLPPDTASAIVVSSTATVSSEQPDFDLSNNSYTLFSRVNPRTADLALSFSAAPAATTVAGPLAYSIAVVNNGPSFDSGVTVTNVLPAGVALLGETVSQGSVSVVGNTVICTFGTLANGGRAAATINATPTVQGVLTATATAVGNFFDPVSSNNTATATVVVAPAADVALTLAAVPNPVVLGSNVNFIATIANSGPNTATNVLGNETLPPGLTILSSAVSQGTMAGSSNFVWTVGTLASGASATNSIIVRTATTNPITCSAFASLAQTDPNPANNSNSVVAQVAPPFVSIVPAGVSLIAESFAPPNGALDAGETVTIQFRLQNVGNTLTPNLVATLLPTGGVSAPSAPQSYGTVKPIGAAGGAPMGRTFTFTANGTNGGTVVATLQLQDGATALGTAAFTFSLSSTVTFANTNIIVIPDSGAGAPYPSTIIVSGVTGHVGKVSASLADLGHTYVHDVSVLLARTNAGKALLMSHVADASSASGLNVSFDDAGASYLPASGGFASGTYKPTAYAPTPAFPAPAPGGPYAANLADFSGIAPNGAWSLYVLDDSPGDSGAITNGWSLALSLVTPVNQLADLNLQVAASANPVRARDSLVYTFVISNAGPATATSVTFSNALPAGVTLLSTTPSQGNCVPNGNTVIGNLASLAAGAKAWVTNVVQIATNALPAGAVSGAVTNTASVAGLETDLHSGDNTASIITTVNARAADVALTLTAVPSPVVLNSNLTYVITVTNYGPGSALGILVTNLLAADVNFVSASVSQGSFSTNNGTVLASLGNLLPGAGASVLVTVAPTTVGTNTTTAMALPLNFDPNLTNNSGSASAVVAPPFVQLALVGAALTAESISPPNGAIDPGETVTVQFVLQNVGTVPNGNNLYATLLATGGVTAPSGAQNYAAMPPKDGAVAKPFTFTASPSGGSLMATLQVSDGSGFSTNLTFVFAGLATFASTTGVTIPDHGLGAPYPSTIVVSNVSGFVSKVTATLNGFTHTFPSDVSVLLANPSGRSALLLSHAGGSHAMNDAVLTFDDAAPAFVPSGSLIAAGSYKPTSYGAPVFFSAPAPAYPYGSALLSLNAGDPNGAWSLYVQDDVPGDSGSIGGWSLNIATVAIPRSATLAAALVNGQFQLTVTGQAGQQYVIQAATDLTTWVPVSTNAADANGTVVFTDPAPPNLQARYYRAVSLAQ